MGQILMGQILMRQILMGQIFDWSDRQVSKCSRLQLCHI